MRFRGPPKIPEIAKGLPVKDVEQKLMILVFFGVGRKWEYCFPSTTESKNHRFGGARRTLVRKVGGTGRTPIKDSIIQHSYILYILSILIL